MVNLEVSAIRVGSGTLAPDEEYHILLLEHIRGQDPIQWEIPMGSPTAGAIAPASRPMVTMQQKKGSPFGNPLLGIVGGHFIPNRPIARSVGSICFAPDLISLYSDSVQCPTTKVKPSIT